MSVKPVAVEAGPVLGQGIARKSGAILITASGPCIELFEILCAARISMVTSSNYVYPLSRSAGKWVHTCSTYLSGLSETGAPYGEPDKLAEAYWELHTKRGRSEFSVATPVDSH